jgi:uncharacterized damage-inducible protein DinB
MDAQAIRHFFDYHFSENRNLWDSYVTQLTQEQFTLESGYSHGSVCDQIIHLISVDDAWFGDLQGTYLADVLDEADPPDRAVIRAVWDQVENGMRAFLDALRDDMLNTKPLSGEDQDLRMWQVLLHVVNHGTDHRAQILRLIDDLGVNTTSQDYIFFAYDNPV